jgi:hypothetical protein
MRKCCAQNRVLGNPVRRDIADVTSRLFSCEHNGDGTAGTIAARTTRGCARRPRAARGKLQLNIRLMWTDAGGGGCRGVPLCRHGNVATVGGRTVRRGEHPDACPMRLSVAALAVRGSVILDDVASAELSYPARWHIAR